MNSKNNTSSGWFNIYILLFKKIKYVISLKTMRMLISTYAGDVSIIIQYNE